MQFTPKKQAKKFQQGGTMSQEEPMVEEEVQPGAAPAEQTEQNPLIMLAEGAMQALQSQDCQMAMQVCQGLIQLIQQMQGAAPEEEATEPVFKQGGILHCRVKKS